MQQMLTYVECNDIYTPLRQIVNNRRLVNCSSSSTSSYRNHSAYREILFLAYTHFGQDNMDHGKIDHEDEIIK